MHVRSISFITRQDCCTARVKSSQFHVGNSTSVTRNPTCGPKVDNSGFYDCDLWGNWVFLRRYTRNYDYYNNVELAVWTQRNVGPYGIASQDSDQSANRGASKATDPYPITMNYRERGAKYAMTKTYTGEHWWLLDLQVPGVTVSHVLVLGRIYDYEAQQSTKYEVRVGED